MKNNVVVRNLFPSQIAVLVLASAIGIPAWAQQSQPATDSSSAAQQSAQPTNTPPQNYTPAAPYVPPAKEGFWGHVNPFARKVWVKKQTDPINNRLSELDEVNAKNARDIQDVDQRAQAGISKAQSTADAANQQASAAGTQAQQANTLAQGASGHVDRLNTTVNGLDQYKQVTDVNIAFRGGSPVLSADAKKQLEPVFSALKDIAAKIPPDINWVLEVDGHTDHRPIHTDDFASNWELSTARAISVVRYAIAQGIPAGHLAAAGFADKQPIDTGTSDDAYRRNRRIELKLTER